MLCLDKQHDHMGNPYPIQQKMAEVEIDVDSEEFQDWNNAFTRFPPATIFYAEHSFLRNFANR